MKKTEQREALLKQKRKEFSLAKFLVKILARLLSHLNFHLLLKFSVAL